MKKIIAIGLAALVLGAAGLSGCGKPAPSAAVGDDGKTKHVIKLPTYGVNLTGMDVLAIADAKGYLDEYGVTVLQTGQLTPPNYVPAVLAGTNDGAQLMTSDGLAAIDNGADLVEVAVSQIAVEGNPHMIYVVLKDSPIKTGADLSGKKVGVSSKLGCTAGFPLEFAAQGGVKDPNAEVEIVVTPEVTLVDALRKGEVDVVGLHSGHEAIDVLYPDVRELFSDYTIFGERGGDIAWFFPRKFVRDNPEAIRGFVGAIAKANNFIMDYPQEAKELYFSICPDVNKEIFHTPAYARDAIVEPSHTQLWIDVLSKGDSIQPLKNKLTVEQVLDNSYNPFYTG